MTRKHCSKCQILKHIMDFAPEKRAADGRRYSCRECDRKRGRDYHAANRKSRNEAARGRRTRDPQRDREYSRRYRAKFVWRTVLQHARKRAAKLGWEFDLDLHVEELKARVAPMVCEMTGVALVPGAGAGSPGKRFWNTVSIDRVDSTKGYTRENIRIVCWAMNCAMGIWGETVLAELMEQWVKRRA